MLPYTHRGCAGRQKQQGQTANHLVSPQRPFKKQSCHLDFIKSGVLCLIEPWDEAGWCHSGLLSTWISSGINRVLLFCFISSFVNILKLWMCITSGNKLYKPTTFHRSICPPLRQWLVPSWCLHQPPGHLVNYSGFAWDVRLCDSSPLNKQQRLQLICSATVVAVVHKLSQVVYCHSEICLKVMLQSKYTTQ